MFILFNSIICCFAWKNRFNFFVANYLFQEAMCQIYLKCMFLVGYPSQQILVSITHTSQSVANGDLHAAIKN